MDECGSLISTHPLVQLEYLLVLLALVLELGVVALRPAGSHQGNMLNHVLLCTDDYLPLWRCLHEDCLVELRLGYGSIKLALLYHWSHQRGLCYLLDLLNIPFIVHHISVTNNGLGMLKGVNHILKITLDLALKALIIITQTIDFDILLYSIGKLNVIKLGLVGIERELDLDLLDSKVVQRLFSCHI